MQSAKVTIRPIGGFREVTGQKAIEVEGPNELGALLRLLSKNYGRPFEDLIRDPKTGELISDLLVIVNGKPLCGSSTIERFKLGDGDEIYLTYLAEGG